jgi:hypothetical protein
MHCVIGKVTYEVFEEAYGNMNNRFEPVRSVFRFYGIASSTVAVIALGCGGTVPSTPPLPTPFDAGVIGTPRSSTKGSTGDLHDCAVESGQNCSLPACGCSADETCAPDPDSKAFELRCQSFSQLAGETCGDRDGQCAPGSVCGPSD